MQGKKSSVIDKSVQLCPPDKYWVRTHERKRTDKKGKIYIEKVKGYCCSYHTNYHKMAVEEKMSYDHLFYALTIYGEAASENAASRRAIAWIVRNRLKKRNEQSYRKIVLRKSQFDCWKPTDPNYKRLQQPGRDGSPDKTAWEECKIIAEEIHNAPEKDNPLPGVYNYFSGKANPEEVSWEKNPFDLPGIARFHFVKLK